jgi:pyruvate dehydrogenase E2 component (dihydrolipoamide acetyltransferase)
MIAEIETDKAVMELEAYESGVLQQILVPEGEVVPIGTPIAMIGEGAVAAQPATAAPGRPAAEQQGPQPSAPAEAAAPQAASPPASPTPVETGDGRADGQRILATPVARRMAKEYGIDLSQVRGTGPDGRIIRENVEDFHKSGQGAQPAAAAPAPAAQATPAAAPPAARPAAAPQPAAAAAGRQVEPLSRGRRAIARSMTESKPGIPHIYVASEVDMGAALALRQQINAEQGDGPKISVNDLVVKAAAKALRAVPALNVSYALTENGHGGMIHHEQVNVSVATALEDGLVAPVVRDTDKKSLSTIAAEIRDLAGRAREGKLRQNELEDATFQVSNLGMFDVIGFVSVITPPQAASLAVGSVRRVPVVQDDGQLGVGDRMLVILSADHRVTDGATAARYLQELKKLLQSPLRLVV